ncbi:hypothetical protein LAZ67_2005025 [Cordylochernes scorpioides]|uniref:Homeobox domain-containing protein n=1 Tax=Cordylochernes scorpioides TaxID=51811 RepID=A0ABY6K493_9ARAC|nr:hypothetical protein LAZ67_2005025 [Cordylochernes scorpioides]
MDKTPPPPQLAGIVIRVHGQDNTTTINPEEDIHTDKTPQLASIVIRGTPSTAAFALKDPTGRWLDGSLTYKERFEASLEAAVQRRKSGGTTRDSTSTLKAWLNEHRKNPYPTKGEKIMLAIITKMTLTQVSTWFANARRRLKKENKMTWGPAANAAEKSTEEGIDMDSGDEGHRTSEDIKDEDEDNENDSKAAIFAIKNCYYSQDRLLKNIAAEINKLNKNIKISLQWIPSHVGVPGNEEADRLAKEGAAGHPDAVNSETYLSARDHTNKLKLQLIRNHRDSFHHSWYQAENPKKQTLQLNRRESTQLARWKSGHLRPLVYKEGAKSFPMCTRCKTEEATPQHSLNCIGKDKRSLYSEPRRVLELLYEHDLQDLV